MFVSAGSVVGDLVPKAVRKVKIVPSYLHSRIWIKNT